MSLFHAVVHIDHGSAHVLQFGATQLQESKIHEHLHFTRQHASGVRSEHEFHRDICDALDGVAEVLVAGGHQALGGFRHYVEKHRPQTAARIVGWEFVDHPTDPQLVALARQRFLGIDDMLGLRVPL